MDHTLKELFFKKLQQRILDTQDAVMGGRMDHIEYVAQCHYVQGLKDSKEYFVEIVEKLYQEEVNSDF